MGRQGSSSRKEGGAPAGGAVALGPAQVDPRVVEEGSRQHQGTVSTYTQQPSANRVQGDDAERWEGARGLVLGGEGVSGLEALLAVVREQTHTWPVQGWVGQGLGSAWKEGSRWAEELRKEPRESGRGSNGERSQELKSQRKGVWPGQGRRCVMTVEKGPEAAGEMRSPAGRRRAAQGPAV